MFYSVPIIKVVLFRSDSVGRPGGSSVTLPGRGVKGDDREGLAGRFGGLRVLAGPPEGPVCRPNASGS